MRSAETCVFWTTSWLTTCANLLKSAVCGLSVSWKSGIAAPALPPALVISAWTASSAASRAFLLVTWCTSWSTNALYAISSFARLMSAVLAGVGEATAPFPVVHAAATKPATTTMRTARRIRLRIGALVGGGAHLGGGCVLRAPLRRRSAEAFVIDVIGDRRMLAADRAVRVAAKPYLAERSIQCVVEEVPADECVADPEKKLDRFGRLQRPDHAGKHAEHARLRARRRELGRRRLGEQAAIARSFERLEDGALPFEPVDRSVEHRYPVLDRRVVPEIPRREVVGSVDPEV